MCEGNLGKVALHIRREAGGGVYKGMRDANPPQSPPRIKEAVELSRKLLARMLADIDSHSRMLHPQPHQPYDLDEDCEIMLLADLILRDYEVACDRGQLEPPPSPPPSPAGSDAGDEPPKKRRLLDPTFYVLWRGPVDAGDSTSGRPLWYTVSYTPETLL